MLYIEGEMNMGDVLFGMDEYFFVFFDVYVKDLLVEVVVVYQCDYFCVKYFLMGCNEW